MITLIITSQFAFVLGILFGIYIYNRTIDKIENKLKTKNIHINLKQNKLEKRE